MHFVTATISLLSLSIFLALPLPALAIPAITCHCFTERAFNPAKPAQADPYFLATTQNSFFAAVFNVDKKTIVMKKQQGISADDLWVAYWVAAKANVPADSLLQAKQTKEAWQDVIALRRITVKTLGVRFGVALNTKSSPARLAEAVVEELFLGRQLLGEKELTALRQAGASNQELIIASVIAARTKQSARQIFSEVKTGAKTWGALLQGARIDPKNMQQEITAVWKL